MRKIIGMAAMAIAALTTITSCNKDETTKPAQPQHLSVREQIAEVIKKADAKLYNSLYGNENKAGNTTVRYLPGYFYIPRTGLDDATCLGTNGVCMVIVTSAKTLDPGADAKMITSDVDETYDPGTAEIILNDSSNPTATPITWFKASLKGGDALVDYK